MIRSFAYNFKSDLSLASIMKRLSELGPWKWYERDNDRFGDFMFAMPAGEPHRSDVKILRDTEKDLYAVNVTFRSEAPDAQAQFDSMRETLFTRLLPGIGARELTKTDDYD
jgi:hypothetical protein